MSVAAALDQTFERDISASRDHNSAHTGACAHWIAKRAVSNSCALRPDAVPFWRTAFMRESADVARTSAGLHEAVEPLYISFTLSRAGCRAIQLSTVIRYTTSTSPALASTLERAALAKLALHQRQPFQGAPNHLTSTPHVV
jgi:hypothetical protein|eukprot:5173557-Prymnesium_polylepis.2